jgi:hypothetical protein
MTTIRNACAPRCGADVDGNWECRPGFPNMLGARVWACAFGREIWVDGDTFWKWKIVKVGFYLAQLRSLVSCDV